jgi:hypothetical protein
MLMVSNSLIKRHRLLQTGLNNNLLPMRNVPHWLRQTQTKSERMKNIFYANAAQKQAGVAKFISDKTNIKPKLFRRDKITSY